MLLWILDAILRRKYDYKRLVWINVLFIISLVWFFTAMMLINYFKSQSHIVSSTRSSIPFVHWSLLINDPLSALRSILNREKILYPVYLLFTLYFIPLLGIFEFIFLVGSWIIFAVLTNYPPYYGGFYCYQHQYSGFVISQIFIALINGLKNLKLHHSSMRKVVVLILFTNLGASILLSPMGLGCLHEIPRPEITDHDILLHEVISKYIPHNASVMTQNDIGPHLCHRENAYFWPWWSTSSLPQYIPTDIEYILLDLSSIWSRGISSYTFRLISNRTYSILVAIDYILLLKYNYNGSPISMRLKHGYFLEIYDYSTRRFILRMYTSNLEYLYRIEVNRDLLIKIRTNIYVPLRGNYKFIFYPNKSISVYIDNIYVEDIACLNIDLSKGYHRLLLIYYGKPSSVSIKWLPPWSTETTVIPKKYLFPTIRNRSTS